MTKRKDARQEKSDVPEEWGEEREQERDGIGGKEREEEEGMIVVNNEADQSFSLSK